MRTCAGAGGTEAVEQRRAQADGAMHCWGRDADGQTDVPSGAGAWASVSAGAAHTCGVAREDGAIYCWGRDDHGQTDVPGAFEGGESSTSAQSAEDAEGLFDDATAPALDITLPDASSPAGKDKKKSKKQNKKNKSKKTDESELSKKAVRKLCKAARNKKECKQGDAKKLCTFKKNACTPK